MKGAASSAPSEVSGYRDLVGGDPDAGATRVVVRPPTVKTESEIAEGLTRIAETVFT
jgi:hypothetical protein